MASAMVQLHGVQKAAVLVGLQSLLMELQESVREVEGVGVGRRGRKCGRGVQSPSPQRVGGGAAIGGRSGARQEAVGDSIARSDCVPSKRQAGARAQCAPFWR